MKYGHLSSAFGRATKIVALGLIAAALGGCAAGRDFSLESAAKIRPGMTKQEVIALIGQPSHTTSRVGDEVWTWARVNLMTGQNKVASVIFVNGVVAPSPTTGKGAE